MPMRHSILALRSLLSLLLLLGPITHSSSAASAAASAATSASSSPTRCLVHSSGIARANSLYRRTSQSTFASNNEKVALARVRLSKGKYYWVLRRKKMVLYKSEVVGGKTRAPPATGWSAEDGARLPLPTVECDGGGGDLSDLAAASTRARASALCPDKGTLCAIMLLKGVKRAKRGSGAGVGAGAGAGAGAGSDADADSDSDSDSARQRRAHLAIMNGTMAAEAKRFGKFNWMFVDAECQHRFALAYGIEQDKLPSMVVLNAAKARYAPFVGGFTVRGLSEFISSMMTGHLRTSVLRGDIPILDDIPCPGMGSGSGRGRGSGSGSGGGGGGSGAGRAGAGGGKDEGDEQQHESEERREEAAGMMEEVRREEEEEGKTREREVVEMMRQDEERENAEVAKAHARLAKDTAERKKKRKEEQFKVKREARKKKKKKKKRRRRGKEKKKKVEVKAEHDEL